MQNIKHTNLTVAKGINNLHDKVQLGDFEDTNARYPKERTVNVLAEANNVDIDSVGMVRRRKGRTPLLISATPHSLWGHPNDDSIVYFVSDRVLYKLNSDYTRTAITTFSSDERASFVAINDEVVVTNKTEIGWVNGTTFVPFQQQVSTFEKLMPAGQYVAFYRGCLFVASGSVLYASKPWNAEVRDERFSEFPMNGHIRMLAPVEDGLWIATEKNVSFMNGFGTDEFEFVHKSDFVPADGCFGYGYLRGDKNSEMQVWWAADGFITGKANGAYENISQDQVRLPSGEVGYCLRTEQDGYYQYIAVIPKAENGNIYIPPTLPIETINY